VERGASTAGGGTDTAGLAFALHALVPSAHPSRAIAARLSDDIQISFSAS
jgi:hypothetical protein